MDLSNAEMSNFDQNVFFVFSLSFNLSVRIEALQKGCCVSITNVKSEMKGAGYCSRIGELWYPEEMIKR